MLTGIAMSYFALKMGVKTVKGVGHTIKAPFEGAAMATHAALHPQDAVQQVKDAVAEAAAQGTDAIRSVLGDDAASKVNAKAAEAEGGIKVSY